MRSKLAILAAAGAALCLVAPAATSSPPAPGTSEAAQTSPEDNDFTRDAASGCTEGSLLVKKMIILTPGGHAGCHVQNVVPPSGCVVPGGVIRWRVLNNCDRLPGSEEEPALEITTLTQIFPDGTTAPAGWLFEECQPRFVELETGAPKYKNLLFCDVPEDASDGTYKYDLRGNQVDPLDPYIEVRRPH
jgi:hypothetical protein